METKPFPILEMKKSLKKIEVEVTKFKKLTKGIPGVEKNIVPILTFIDILKFHVDDLKDEE